MVGAPPFNNKPVHPPPAPLRQAEVQCSVARHIKTVHMVTHMFKVDIVSLQAELACKPTAHWAPCLASIMSYVNPRMSWTGGVDLVLARGLPPGCWCQAGGMAQNRGHFLLRIDLWLWLSSVAQQSIISGPAKMHRFVS